MRELREEEMRMNGCAFCYDVKRIRKQGFLKKHCPYERCPYEELNDFRTYLEYIKSKGDLKWLTGKK